MFPSDLTLIGPILLWGLNWRLQDDDVDDDDVDDDDVDDDDDDDQDDDDQDDDDQDERPITFKVLRYALIPYEQLNYWAQPLPEPKGRAIEAALPLQEPSPRFFRYRNKDHALVGFSRLPEDSRFLLGRLAKKRETAIGQLRQHDVVEITTEDWLPIWVLFDTVDQYIAVEIHNRFGQVDHVVRVLQQSLTESVGEEYRHEIIVSPVTDARTFWEIIERSPRIYRARLRFVSPNFIDTRGQFSNELRRWKRLFNQTEAVLDLRNDDGQLSLPTDRLKEPVKYIAAGEGDWKLTVEDAGQRRSKSSSDSSESLRLRFPRASHPQDASRPADAIGRVLVDAFLRLLGQRRDNP